MSEPDELPIVQAWKPITREELLERFPDPDDEPILAQTESFERTPDGWRLRKR